MNQQYVLTVGNGLLTKGGYSLGVISLDPYNPLELPSHTIRCEFIDDYDVRYQGIGDRRVQVSSSPNVWDITKYSDDWSSLFWPHCPPVIKSVIGANTEGVTNMGSLFRGQSQMRSVCLFDTRSVTDMSYMFNQCRNLVSVPSFPTSSVLTMRDMMSYCDVLQSVGLMDTGAVTDMSGMFDSCYVLASLPQFDTHSVTSFWAMCIDCYALKNIPTLDTSSAVTVSSMFYSCFGVESGALALYNQMSLQATPPTNYADCFYRCGRDAPQDAPIHAEMAQIPTSWGGLME